MNKRPHLNDTPLPLDANNPLFNPSFPYSLAEPTNKGGTPTWDGFHPQLPPADPPMPFFSSALCEPNGTFHALPHLGFSGNLKFSSPQAACSLQGIAGNLQSPPSLQGDLQELWELSNEESPPSWGPWSDMAAEEDPPMNAWPCFLNPGMAPPDAMLNGSIQTSSVFAPTACKLGGDMTQISKQRLRWTPELHKLFVEAVSQLGGPEKATPKCILTHMDVAGLQLSQIKSHLQKYRITKDIPDSQEARAEKKRSASSLEHSGALDTTIALQMTESLRLQMEMQKQLHDQLEVQRKLQLRIEEQGKHLQRMFEKQQKERPPTSPHLIELGVDSHIPSTNENRP